MGESAGHKANQIAAACAVVAVLCFSSNDVGIKLLSGGYALHQVVIVRTLIAMSILLFLVVPFNGGFKVLRTKRLKMHICRGLCVVFANMCFFLALAAMPLADAVAVFFVSPLLITVFSVVFLREHVGPFRWAAIVVGLLGVIVIVRPGTSAFQLASLLPLFAATGYATLHILTRKIGGTESAITMAIYIQLTFLVVCIVVGLFMGDGRYAGSGDPSLEFLFRAWIWSKPENLLVFMVIGAGSAFGGYLISQAYRVSEAAFVAPFEYIAMPIAIFWGAVIFDDWPDLTAWFGMILIIGSGLFMVWRETVTRADSTAQRRRIRR